MTDKTIQKQKLPLAKRLGFGSIEFSNSIMFTCFLTFGMYFFTDIVGLSPAFAGTILAIGTLWDAVTDPLVGVLSDQSESRFGRRRPFLLGVAVPFGLICWLMFTNWGFGPAGTKAYYLIMVILFYSVMTLLDVPYTALGAELTQDYDERTSLNTWRSLFCQVAAIIGGTLPISMAVWIGERGGGVEAGWSCVGAIIGVLATTVILIGWRATRGGELFPEHNEVHIKDIFTGPLKNRPFRYVIGFYACGIMSLSLAASFFVYYLTSYMQYGEEQISLTMAVFFGPGILYIPLIDIISKKFSKKASWYVFSLLTLLSTLAVFLFVKPGRDILLHICVFGMSAMSMIVYQVGWSMIPDCIEIDEYKTGYRREGIYYGIITLLQKAGSAIILGAGGLMLQLIGYNAEAAVQSETTTQGIRLILFSGEILLVLISVFLVWRFPLTREKHAALVQALQEEDRESVDESVFADCL